MKIEKLNPPINGYEKETSTSAMIADGRLERLECALEECIHATSKKYTNYNFYWYKEKDYQRYCQEKILPKFAPIVQGIPTAEKNVLLGYVFDKDVYINLDAFPVDTFPKAFAKEIAKISKGHGNPDNDVYKEKCREILKQI